VLGLIVAGLVTIRVLVQAGLSFEELAQREVRKGDKDPLIRWIHESTLLLRSSDDSINAMIDDYRKQSREASEALEAYYERPDATAEARARSTDEAFLELNGKVAELLASAKCRQTQRNLNTARSALGAVAAIIGLGIVALTWAINAPARPAVDLRGGQLTSGVLSGAELRKANLAGMTIEDMDLRGTYLGDAVVTGVKWIRTTCPDGVHSGNAGGTCAGHLKP
jgi:hypothetical protein